MIELEKLIKGNLHNHQQARRSIIASREGGSNVGKNAVFTTDNLHEICYNIAIMTDKRNAVVNFLSKETRGATQSTKNFKRRAL